jgi:hypothetical protein
MFSTRWVAGRSRVGPDVYTSLVVGLDSGASRWWLYPARVKLRCTGSGPSPSITPSRLPCRPDDHGRDARGMNQEHTSPEGSFSAMQSWIDSAPGSPDTRDPRRRRIPVTRPQPPPPPVLDQSLVQVLLGALLAEPVLLAIPGTIPPPEPPHLHLGRPWPRP